MPVSKYFQNTHAFSDLTTTKKFRHPFKKANIKTVGSTPLSLSVGMGGNYKSVPFGRIK